MKITIQAGYAPGETGTFSVIGANGDIVTLSPENAHCAFDVVDGDAVQVVDMQSAVAGDMRREAEPPALPGLADALLKAAPVADEAGNG